MTGSSTFAVLTVSGRAYDEIAAKLRNAGYWHLVTDDGIALDGLGLERGSAEPKRYRCEGCGHEALDTVGDIQRLRAAGAIACCPERRMMPVGAETTIRSAGPTIGEQRTVLPASYPDPTPAMLDGDRLFDAIWDAIKGWDLQRGPYAGYAGATGNDARRIYEAVLATGLVAQGSGADFLEVEPSEAERAAWPQQTTAYVESLEAALERLERRPDPGREDLAAGREHLTVTATFQSDKYPWCQAGFVPLKTSDPMAADLLAAYAERRRLVDAVFADDLLEALGAARTEAPDPVSLADRASRAQDLALPPCRLRSAQGGLLGRGKAAGGGANTALYPWPMPPQPVDTIAWTAELEQARVELCEYWLSVAAGLGGDGDVVFRGRERLAQKARETEQALTILGHIALQHPPAVAAAAASGRSTGADGWQCLAQKQPDCGARDCGWPDCGCDPEAQRVMERLVEQGWQPPFSSDMVMTIISSAVTACSRFNTVVHTVENRCLAADGPVTPTLREMREDELAALWSTVQDIRTAMEDLRAAMQEGAAADSAEPQSARIAWLEDALRFGIHCCLNGLRSRGLPLEWSRKAGIGVMLKALGCDSCRLDEEARRVLRLPAEEQGGE